MTMPGASDVNEEYAELREVILKVARDHGCSCSAEIQVVHPFPDMMGFRVLHDQSCIGLQRDRGMKGVN